MNVPDKVASQVGAYDRAVPGRIGRRLVAGHTKLFEDDGLVRSLARCCVVSDPHGAEADRVTRLTPTLLQSPLEWKHSWQAFQNLLDRARV